MTKLKKTLSLILSLLMVGGSLAACATAPEDPAQTAGVTTEAVSEGESTIKDNLPDDLDLQGTTITIFSDHATLIGPDELSGDPVSDALFERNKFVESRLNTEIAVEAFDGKGDAYAATHKMATLVQSGSTEYDAIVSSCYTILDQLLSGTFADLANAAYLDLPQPWWSQDFNRSLSFRDSQYTLAGHILVSIYRSAYATVFNQNRFIDARQPFPYEYVENGTWTLDKQISLVPLFHQDTNGDGQQDPNDYYGLVTAHLSKMDPYWASCEVDIVGKTSDGEFELIFDSGEAHEMAEKVLFLLYETDNSVYLEPAYDPASVFAKGTSAMATITLGSLESTQFRDMEDIYGVVPMPRFSEDQDAYYSTLHDGFSVFAVPTTIQGDRLDTVAAVLEAMASASYNIVKPVYYETTLRTKLVNDPQSSEMMDMVVNNLLSDPGYFFVDAMRGFRQGLRDILISRQNTTVSYYATRSKIDKKSIQQINKKLERLADRNQ